MRRRCPGPRSCSTSTISDADSSVRPIASAGTSSRRPSTARSSDAPPSASALNDFFAREGGHVGYGVAPQYRRKGYALEILRQAINVARAEGVERVLVTCTEDNVGSRNVIERNGGVLESIVTAEDGRSLRRYWIE